MAVFKFNKNQKYCGNCDYFMVCRSVDSIWVPNQVVIDDSKNNDHGICANRRSGWWNMRRKITMVCNFFDLWTRLKHF